MNLYVLFVLSFLPTIFVFVLFAAFVPKFHIPTGLIACVLGILAVFPASFIQYAVFKIPFFNRSTFFALFFSALLVNGLVEESVKGLFLYLVPRKRLSFLTFFCCAALFGLSAGSFESVIYVVRKISGENLPGLIASVGVNAIFRMVLARIFSAQLIHAFCTGLLGFAVFTFVNKPFCVVPFIYAVVVHGLFNFFVSFSSAYNFLAIVAILFAAVECRIWYKSIQKDEKQDDFSKDFEKNQLTKQE